MINPLWAVSIYWQLPFLLVVVSLVYSATRYDDWDAILLEAFRWGIRMAGFLGGIGVVLYILATLETRYWGTFFIVGGIIFLIGLWFVYRWGGSHGPPAPDHQAKGQ